MQKVTQSLRANLENLSNFVGHSLCVKPQFGRSFWNREFSRNLVKIRGCPLNLKGNADTLLHAKVVVNEVAVTSRRQAFSALLMELLHKGITVVKTPRIFEHFCYPIPGFLISRVFWYLKNAKVRCKSRTFWTCSYL